MREGRDVKVKSGVVHASDVTPGPVIIHSSKVAHRPVSQETIKKLRLIGADRDTIAFAERQAAKS